LLTWYAERLAVQRAHLEALRGQHTIAAVEGYIACAVLAGEVLEESWQDTEAAVGIAAKAIQLSRSFLEEFLTAVAAEADADPSPE
jgi:hypothetical protein